MRWCCLSVSEAGSSTSPLLMSRGAVLVAAAAAGSDACRTAAADDTQLCEETILDAA